MEVLRAAVSETEQYARVQVEQVADVAILGAAVADTIHLIAELVDNATSFSPPGSPVEVTSRMVARGVVVDVSDQGLGMKDGVREWANAMMAEAPEFDAMALRADSSLGLFVVARLAARLGITVTFDPSRYGGLRATVLIPSQHLAGENDGQADGTGSTPAEDTAVLAPVGGPAPQAAEGSLRTMDTPSSFSGQIPMKRDTKPRPYPARALTAPDALPSVPAAVPDPVVAAEPEPDVRPTDDRPRLPRREPQQNLVAQLENEPDDSADDVVAPGEGTARTLAAFHKGTRRGRGGPGDS
jgi:hypothetical protein